MSWLEVNLGHEERAVELAEQAVELRRSFLRQVPENTRAASDFAAALTNLASRLVMSEAAGEQRFARSEQYAREAMAVAETHSLGPGVSRQIRRSAHYNLVLVFAFQDRVEDTRVQLNALAGDTTENPRELRELADGWSELLAAALRSEQSEQLIKQAGDQTLLELERAINAGYRDHVELTTCEVLAPFRTDTRFQALVELARGKRE